ncbi:MAG: hypothetical protein QXU18_13460 [Thermoplasmatales archaeon]
MNVGSGSEVSIHDLAQTIIKLTSSSSGIAFLESRVDDPFRRSANTTKNQTLLEWLPGVSLAEEVAQTVEWTKRVTQ